MTDELCEAIDELELTISLAGSNSSCGISTRNARIIRDFLKGSSATGDETYGEPVTATLKECDDGQKRWIQSTRDGEEVVGLEDGKTLALAADTFEVGTIVTFQEPMS